MSMSSGSTGSSGIGSGSAAFSSTSSCASGMAERAGSNGISRAERMICSSDLSNFSVKFHLHSSFQSASLSSDLLIAFVTEEMAQNRNTGLNELNGPLKNVNISEHMWNDFHGKFHTYSMLYSPPASTIPRVLLVGVGAEAKVNLHIFRQSVNGAMNYVTEKLHLSEICFLFPPFPVFENAPQTGTVQALEISKAKTKAGKSWKKSEVNEQQLIDAAARVCVLSNHLFDKYLKVDKEKWGESEKGKIDERATRVGKRHFVKDIHFLLRSSESSSPSSDSKALLSASVISESTLLARELANDRPNVIHPQSMEDFAKKLSETHPSLHFRAVQADELNSLGYHLLTSVGQAAKHKGRLVILEYKGQAVDEKNDHERIALVGKGICFDSGGLNIKPTGSIETMHLDMSGSAAVLSSMKALAQLAPPHLHVIGVLALAENAVDALSYYPHQIIQTKKGSVQVSNTDAEGRLALADAFTFVQSTYAPITTLIDLATLTGACVVALGEYSAGLFSNDELLSDELLFSGWKVHERCWRMPILSDHVKELSSVYSDFKSMGAGRNGGACTAAAFLSKFIEDDVKFAHIDIAGPAMYSKKRDWFSEEGTGFGVQILLQYLLNKQKQLEESMAAAKDK